MDSPSSFVLPSFTFKSLPAAFKVLFRAPRASHAVLYLHALPDQSTLDFSKRHSKPESSVYFVRRSRKASFRNSSPCSPGFHHVEIRHVSYYARRPRAEAFVLRKRVFFINFFSFWWGAVFVCPLVLPPQHYSFSFQKIIPFSPSSKTTYAPLEEESTQRRAALRLAHAVRAEEKEAKQTTCRFFVARSRRVRATGAMRVQKTTTTTMMMMEQQQQQRHRKQQQQKTFTSTSSSPSSSFAPRTHGAKRMAENAMVHKRSF